MTPVSRTSGFVALALAAVLAAAPPAGAQGPQGPQGPRSRPQRPAPATPTAPAPPPVLQECTPPGAVPAQPMPPPMVLRVDPAPGGYVVLGRCFGYDRERLRVFEDGTAVPAAAVTGLTDLRIEVRSEPQGIVRHKVTVGDAESNALTVTHCRCSERGTCDASGRCACHAGYAGPTCATTTPR